LDKVYFIFGQTRAVADEEDIEARFIMDKMWLRPPLWSSGQSSWLRIQTSRSDSQSYQNFWEVVGLERVHWASWIQLRSCLEEIVAAPVQKIENTAVGIRHAYHVAPTIRKSWH
jgi:hypothetical protein